MPTRPGLFDPELVLAEWFDESQQVVAWFDEELVEAPTAATLVGTSTLSFSTSGALVGLGPVSTTVNVAFTTSATLIGRGAISGTTSPTFTTSGAIVGRGFVSAASSVAFANSATLIGIGLVSGTANVSFSASATLTNSGGVLDAITGSVALAFSTSGALVSTQAPTAQDIDTGADWEIWQATTRRRASESARHAAERQTEVEEWLRTLRAPKTVHVDAIRGRAAVAFRGSGHIATKPVLSAHNVQVLRFRASGQLTGVGRLAVAPRPGTRAYQIREAARTYRLSKAAMSYRQHKVAA